MGKLCAFKGLFTVEDPFAGKLSNKKQWIGTGANPALKTKTGNKEIFQIDKIQWEQIANRADSYFRKGGHSATKTELKV